MTKETPYTIRHTPYVSHLSRHKALLLILLIFTAFTLYNSTTLPLGEAADETDHYQYLRFVARSGRPPLTAAERREAGFKGGLAPLYYWLTAWPIAWVGEQTPPDIRRVDSRPERFIPTDGLGINHVLGTLDERWPWRGQPLAWHLVRWLSLPMAWVTLIATYALTRRLFPDQKSVSIGATAFIAFLPRFVISSAVINDDNLVFALIALLLLIQVIILQGDRRPRVFAIFGALFGLTLMTKYFSLILMPEILFTLFLAWPSGDANHQTGAQPTPTHAPSLTPHAIRHTPYAIRFTFLRSHLAFLLALLLTAGPWFTFITLRFNRIDELGLIPGLAAALGEPQITEGLVGLLSGQAIRPPAATYTLPAWFGLLYRSFWFEYGWMRIFAPTWLYVLFTIFLLIAFFGLTHKILVYKKNSRRSKTTNGVIAQQTRHHPPRNTQYAIRNTQYVPWLLALHLALFISVVLVRYVLSATIDTGQGRHLYPALPVMAILVSLGLNHLRFWILDFGFWISKASPTKSFISRSLLSASRSLLPATGYLLPAICYLLPAFISLFPAAFILPHYHPLPLTIRPPDQLPIAYRYTFSPTDEFFLAGIDAGDIVSAGETLPVTLYWRVEDQVNQDYLVSLCLQDEAAQPVACWRGHFVNGRYPPRAWEAGETIADTIYIPIPTCYRILDKSYRLQLELWPLRPDSLRPAPEETPILQHTFPEPLIAIRPTDPRLAHRSQTIDLWRAGQRLTGPVTVETNQALTQINYAPQGGSPVFIAAGADKRWRPLPYFETDSYLPCDDGPTPFAYFSHFIADASLSPHRYQSTAAALSDLSLAHLNRSRAFAPITTTLSFSQTLTPLSLHLPNQPAINLQLPTANQQPAISNQQLPITTLPLILRWQARRWMADPLVISLKLLDKDFAIGGERVATLGDRYPNVLWAPTEIIEETYPLQLNPDAPPGLYQLELSLIRQDQDLPGGFEYLPVMRYNTELGQNLYPLTLRLLDPAHNNLPSTPFEAQLGDSIYLTGYDLQAQPLISLTLYWQSTAKISADYTVFTQLIGPDGQVWAQWDNPPQAGRYPTTAWITNDQVVDRYNLSLREGFPVGEYRLLVGMYDPTTGQRLPATINDQPQPDQAIELARFSLTP